MHSITKNKEIVNFNKIVSDIISVFKDKADFRIQIDPTIEKFTNKVTIKHILLNLISNGIKYNDKEKPILKINISEENKQIKIVFEDNGMGIREDEIKNIFKIFKKTSNRPQDGSKSIGIGLATVKSLISSLDGDVKLTSRVGQGTKFEIIL